MMAKVVQRVDTKLPSIPYTECNGTPVDSSRRLNEKIVRKVLSIHFKDRRIPFLRKELESGPELDSLVAQVVDRAARLTERYSKGDIKMPTVEDLIEEDWCVHAGNLNSEFIKVIEGLFHESVNWGRITALLQFSGVYCSYAMHRGLPESIIESVSAWTVLVLENDLRSWFKEHSWVSKVGEANSRNIIV